MSVALEPGFKKADSSNIPLITSEMVFAFITRLAQCGTTSPIASDSSEDYKIDYVQVKRKDLSVLKGRVAYNDCEDNNYYMVELVVDEQQSDIVSVSCEGCEDKQDSCPHAIAFLFWAHRKSNDEEPREIKSFWSSEQYQVLEEKVLALKIKDIFADEENRFEEELDSVTDEDGQAFLKAILDEMEKSGLTDSPLYNHCRPIVDEFEPVYIHHAMLDNANNSIRDYKTFVIHMEEIARRGLFEQLREVTAYNYKKHIWMETQYCRIRCSLMQRISARKDTTEDEAILDSIFCTNREENIEERKQLKDHKRYILKQTEKLENKEYRECGLILCESYPYICASPDGITDDHIVEIKAPKTDEEFEKYLVGKETIAPKYMAQIQIQMYFANVPKALYCVLSPTFDTNGALHYVWVQADMQQIVPLLSAAEDFWKDIVFPRLKKIYLDE